jgi:threonine aldolase
MVFASFERDPAAVIEAADAADVRLAINGRTCRMVTHLDVDADDIDAVIGLIAGALSARQ